MQSIFSKFCKGFSLPEVAVTLAILGILTTTFYDVNLLKNNQQDAKNLRAQFKEIEIAIDTYVAKNGYLPCPARRNSAVASSTFGVATDCNTAAPSGTVDAGYGTDVVRIGAVPVRSLDLPDSMMFDPWTNRINYVVIKNLAQNSTNFLNYSTASTSVITIKDASGNQINTNNSVSQQNLVAWGIISYGKSARGAFTHDGTQRACGSFLDQENCDDDNIFVDAYYNNNSTNSFDNYLLWKSFNQQVFDEQTFIVPIVNTSQCPALYNPSSFVPTSITGLRLWLDAKDQTTAFTDTACTSQVSSSGQSIMCLKDKSGNGYNALQTQECDAPEWTNPGAYPYLDFTGGEYYKISGSPSGAVFPNGSTLNAMEFFMVSTNTNNNGGQMFTHNSGIHFQVPDNSDKVEFKFNTSFVGNKFNYTGSGLSLNTRYLWNCRANVPGTEFKCWNNDKLMADTINVGPALTIGTQDFFIGCESSNESFCQRMQLNEFIIYDRKLTDDERFMLKGYLYKRWWN